MGTGGIAGWRNLDANPNRCRTSLVTDNRLVCRPVGELLLGNIFKINI